MTLLNGHCDKFLWFPRHSISCFYKIRFARFPPRMEVRVEEAGARGQSRQRRLRSHLRWEGDRLLAAGWQALKDGCRAAKPDDMLDLSDERLEAFATGL